MNPHFSLKTLSVLIAALTVQNASAYTCNGSSCLPISFNKGDEKTIDHAIKIAAKDSWGINNAGKITIKNDVEIISTASDFYNGSDSISTTGVFKVDGSVIIKNNSHSGFLLDSKDAEIIINEISDAAISVLPNTPERSQRNALIWQRNGSSFIKNIVHGSSDGSLLHIQNGKSEILAGGFNSGKSSIVLAKSSPDLPVEANGNNHIEVVIGKLDMTNNKGSAVFVDTAGELKIALNGTKVTSPGALFKTSSNFSEIYKQDPNTDDYIPYGKSQLTLDLDHVTEIKSDLLFLDGTDGNGNINLNAKTERY